ncbi:ribosome biogenesis GTPase Der [Botrimarina hoheduenensis]|uniref:GTPase Der n=1 Tax=Botrimarina hoheduenensis TaxID=2528000 RepID=A0A5C5WB03_9BACT|nr:ribosome biogenesis GTPase Der [Botrimarina hoheduenensis]TWT47774.1 GTPase Der [Botrimarina hoheduenensis]
MGIPQVAIVGRPNVGKSSLLNWLAGLRVAIVDDRPGITRDRVVYLMEHEGRFFELIDTGGMGHMDADALTQDIENQISQAIDSADLILFVVDTREGIATMDSEVAKRLRYLKTTVICVANKTDHEKFDTQADDFGRLGHGQPLKVSTEQNRNRSVLLNRIFDALPEADEANGAPTDPDMKVAIVGRRNVGKSTFVNTLAQAERMIVSEVPGTTRDSVDVRFELDGRAFVAIDTPGIRRTRAQQTYDIDFYGAHRAQRSIRRADVVFLFLDCTQRIGKIDKQLADYIGKQHKPCVLVVNKWDQLAGSMPTEKWVNYLADNFRMMPYAPIAFITAKTGKNVKALLNHGQMLFKQSMERVGTGELNRVVRDAVRHTPPPLYKNRRPKIYYATQVGTQPPTIVLFVSQPAAITPQYQRYLLGRFRDEFPFAEVPMKIYLRRRESSDTRDEVRQPEEVAPRESTLPAAEPDAATE